MDKLTLLETLLRERELFVVVVDTRRLGVIVPPHLKGREGLRLTWGLNLPIPIRDLMLDKDGLSGLLSFDSKGYWCYLPLNSIVAAFDPATGLGMVWELEPYVNRHSSVFETPEMRRKNFRVIQGGKI